jgi:two-component system, sensor histidine kinase PdtaS
MTSTPRPQFASRFAIRFAIILALAMLPAGFFAFVQTSALEREVQSRSELALMGATLQAAAAETSLIGRVRGMVGSLASAVPLVVDDPAACEAMMRELAMVEPLASVIAFVPTSGLMTCSSVGREFDFSSDPLFQKVRDIQAPYLWINPRAPVAQTSVVGISHPVYDQAGAYVGYAVMTVPHNSIEELRFSAMVAGSELEKSTAFWTFDKAGTLLTSNLDLALAERQLPANRPLTDFVGGEGSVFRATSISGETMTYAVVPIIAEELYLMSSFRPKVSLFAQYEGVTVYLPTLLMWLVGLAVSGFAAEFLVTRHVRTLNRSILSFARGDRRLQVIDLRNAPSELDELAKAYQSMTESITRSEAELEDSVHQKEVLLREVHHRVKNNLQLISSIMNIQIRSAKSGEAKDLLKNLQERIMSLATVHRGLYQTSGLADVRARELIPDIVRQILSMSSGPEKPFVTQNDIDDLRLVPDQAVPLSLLLAEALTNAIKHSGATRDAPGQLTVRLKRSGGSDAVLEVINSRRIADLSGSAAAVPDTGIGSQLITAFVQQLGGRQEGGVLDDGYFLRLTFTVSPLALAENRQTPEGSDAVGPATGGALDPGSPDPGVGKGAPAAP